MDRESVYSPAGQFRLSPTKNKKINGEAPCYKACETKRGQRLRDERLSGKAGNSFYPERAARHNSAAISLRPGKSWAFSPPGDGHSAGLGAEPPPHGRGSPGPRPPPPRPGEPSPSPSPSLPRTHHSPRRRHRRRATREVGAAPRCRAPGAGGPAASPITAARGPSVRPGLSEARPISQSNTIFHPINS